MIRAALSTLGCSGMPLEQAAELASGCGFSGMELRAAHDEPIHTDLSVADRAAAVAVLQRRNIVPLAIASYVRIAADDIDDDAVIADAIAHGDLAADLGADYLRLFPGGHASANVVAARLAAIGQALDGSGVTVAIETHDSHPTVSAVASLLSDQEDMALIWDVLHPWRAGETVAQSLEAGRDRLGYVQIKDVVSADDMTPLAPGDGILPLADVAQSLKNQQYRGWISWEYERKWFPDAAPIAEIGERVAQWLIATFD